MSAPKQTPKMEALIASLTPDPVQRCGVDFHRPRPQTPYIYRPDEHWRSSPSQSQLAESNPSIDPKVIRLISWNIDMLVPLGHERMTAALQHLETLVASTPLDKPIVILLQEMTSLDLDLITSSSWVQTRFNITDKDSSSWLSPQYGTTALVDVRLNIARVFRVPFPSKFDRDGLFIDIVLSSSSAPEPDSAKVLRLCNVHLESLIADPPIRPHQLSAAAVYLHAPEVACALLAGDLNAIQPFDRTLHFQNHLQDAYLALGGEEDDDEGYTWGYQVHPALRQRFGCSRMDKILFRGDVQVKAFERIGVGVEAAGEQREEATEGAEQVWVSDHYGVLGDFDLTGQWMLGQGPGDVMPHL